MKRGWSVLVLALSATGAWAQTTEHTDPLTGVRVECTLGEDRLQHECSIISSAEALSSEDVVAALKRYEGQPLPPNEAVRADETPRFTDLAWRGMTRLPAPPEQFLGVWYSDLGPRSCEDTRGPSITITDSTVEFRGSGRLAIEAVGVGDNPDEVVVFPEDGVGEAVGRQGYFMLKAIDGKLLLAAGHPQLTLVRCPMPAAP